MPVDPIRVLTELHGSAGLVAVAALVHPVVLLRTPGRRAPIACWAATAATTVVFGGGLALYGVYRERVKHDLFVTAPSIAWLFERKEHLALGAVAAGAYNNYGCVANQPVYDDWGQFVGYQRVRVPCY